jgi:hypothetical protein
MPQNKSPSEFFIFGSGELAEPGEPDDAFVFTAGPDVDVKSVAEALGIHIDETSPPGRLFLLGPETSADKIVATTAEERLRDVLPSFTRYLDTPPLFPLTFDEKGDIRQLAGEPIGGDLTKAITREGLRWIFDKREGMLHAGLGFHYLNPSKRHTTSFIRTGNVLLHSAEIAFVAMGVLRWWPAGLRSIFVDTASISSVGYALIELRRMFEPDLQLPSIDSFSSYEGLKEFDFLTDSLCLISASTSGSLQRRIIRRGLPSDRVVTLFYCGPPKGSDGVLCDLTERPGQAGIAEPKSADAVAKCEMCQRGSALISISGDQFLPANPDVDQLVLSAEHAPKWLDDFLRAVLGQGIVRCHAGATVEGARVREIFFHLEKAVGGIPDVESNEGIGDQGEGELRFPDHLKQKLDAIVPASIDAIVHVDNRSSKTLAKTVNEYFAERAGRALPTVTTDNLERDPGALPKKASVLVVVGAISSGRTLLGISQFLRNVAEARSIVYLIGVARSSSGNEWKRLKSNLTWGRRELEYPLGSVTFAYLPAELNPASSPWPSERRLLGEIIDHIEGLGDGPVRAAIDEIEARRQQIDDAGASEGEGLTRTAFLPQAVDGAVFPAQPKAMELHDNFVFWRGIPRELKQHPTQAEVYLTLVAILHHQRDGGGGALVQHEYNGAVLAPANFGRFNDGVVQAAILRAARPRELDYSRNKDASAQMRDTLIRLIERREKPEGEAAAEFLLALAGDQLFLMPDDREAVVEFLTKEDLPPFMWALAQWIKDGSTAEPAETELAAAAQP